MKVFKIRVGVLATVTGLALLGAGVTTAQASKPPAHKVTLCHRTGSVAGGNTHAGYSVITVDIAAVGNAKSVRGHDGHNQVGNGPDGDIIPSYTYRSYTYPGKNLANGGAEILANGCKVVTPQAATTTTTTTTPPVTTTTSATTPPESTTTTPPESATTTPPVTTTTAVEVAGATATTTVAPAPVDVLGAAASENPLPAGAAAGQANTGTLVGAGLTGLTALLALGAGFILRRRHGVS